MEYRLLGRSGFKVPVFTFGTGNFGGKGGVYDHRGSSDVADATRLCARGVRHENQAQ